MGCVIGGLGDWVGWGALDEEIHHINVRYLCRDLIYVLRGIFWINNGWGFIHELGWVGRSRLSQVVHAPITPRNCTNVVFVPEGEWD